MYLKTLWLGPYILTGFPRWYSVHSVAQLCLTLCDPMNCSMPGLPVHHQLLEFTQTHAHRVSDAIRPSHPLLSPSPPSGKEFACLSMQEMQETQAWSLGGEDPLEEEMATPSSILAYGNPLQYSCLKNSMGKKSLVGYSPWGRKESWLSDWARTHLKLSSSYYIVPFIIMKGRSLSLIISFVLKTILSHV